MQIAFAKLPEQPAPVSKRRALITAAASGIGAQIARRALESGYAVTICDIDEERGNSFAREVGCAFYTCDLAKEADVVSVVRSVGPVDLLVNNGGVSGPTKPLSGVTTDEWNRVISVNLTAQFLACREMVSLMASAGTGGCIINVSSVAAQIGYPNRCPYAASKSGILGLTAALAREVGGNDIRVNAILPGATEGQRMEQVIADFAAANGLTKKAAEAAYLNRNAIPRMVTADEVAATVLFLASDAARSITGQFIRVDAGFQ